MVGEGGGEEGGAANNSQSREGKSASFRFASGLAPLCARSEAAVRRNCVCALFFVSLYFFCCSLSVFFLVGPSSKRYVIAFYRRALTRIALRVPGVTDAALLKNPWAN